MGYKRENTNQVNTLDLSVDLCVERGRVIFNSFPSRCSDVFLTCVWKVGERSVVVVEVKRIKIDRDENK